METGERAESIKMSAGGGNIRETQSDAGPEEFRPESDTCQSSFMFVNWSVAVFFCSANEMVIDSRLSVVYPLSTAVMFADLVVKAIKKKN